jgi:hypothetical protein
MAEPVEKIMENLEKKVLPQTLADLTDRHEHISQVIQVEA